MRIAASIITTALRFWGAECLSLAADFVRGDICPHCRVLAVKLDRESEYHEETAERLLQVTNEKRELEVEIERLERDLLVARSRLDASIRSRR